MIDPENGSIVHSEAQAYALRIAVFADEPHTFQSLWSATQRNLRRTDGLLSWRDEHGRGITDPNNATDADVSVAASLALAALRWDRPAFLRDAMTIADAIGDKTLKPHRGCLCLMPACVGFDGASHPDGPVLSLAYYDLRSLDIIRQIAPQHDVQTVMDHGDAFILAALERKTLTDWNSVENPTGPGRCAAWQARTGL